MQNDTRFVVNIVPLQNVQSNASGLDATATLSNSVADIQKMVNYSQKTLYADYITSLAGGNIGVKSALNLSNVNLLSNGNVVSFGSSGGGSATISTLSTATSLLTLGTDPVLNVASQGTNLFTLSSGVATFSGACYAQQFLTLSDERTKTGLRPWRSGVLEGVCGLGTYVYSYKGALPGEGMEIGLLAHEVKAAFPDCVSAREGGNSYVKYDSVVALLVKAVGELREELAQLRATGAPRV
jgi:hypothetical protein